MYCYDGTVRYSELDSRGRLSIGGLLNYFQDCSTFQSEALGVGVEYLSSRDQAWVLASWQIDIIRRPSLCEKITVGTFPYEFKKSLGFRNFFLKDEKGEYLAKANSIWMLVNIKNMTPQMPEDIIYQSYVLEPALEMDYSKRHITILPDGIEKEPFSIKKYHLDTNNHVNNGQYICMAQEYLPDEFEVGRIRAEYKKSAFYQDMLYPYVVKTDEMYQVSLRDKEQKVYVNIEFAK